MITEHKKIPDQKITDFADKSLLIVDDDNPLRDRLARAMEKKGFKVDQAESVKQGIIRAISVPPAFAVVDLRLSDGNGLEVIKEIRRVSKPGRRIYTRADSIPIIQSGLGIAIVSTSMGVMSGNDARSKNIGGEIICRVF